MLAPRGGDDDPCPAGHGQRPGGGARRARRPLRRLDQDRRQAAEARRAPALPAPLQAGRRHEHHRRPRGAAHGRGPRARRGPRAGLPGGAARLPLGGPGAAHQRRGTRPPGRASALRRAAGIPRESPRRALGGRCGAARPGHGHRRPPGRAAGGRVPEDDAGGDQLLVAGGGGGGKDARGARDVPPRRAPRAASRADGHRAAPGRRSASGGLARAGTGRSRAVAARA